MPPLAPVTTIWPASGVSPLVSAPRTCALSSCPRVSTAIIARLTVPTRSSTDWFFESEAALSAYRASELAASIPGTYQVQGSARREVLGRAVRSPSSDSNVIALTGCEK